MLIFEEQKTSILSSTVSTVKLQGLWRACFKSEKLVDARTLILYMAMFMIFGSRMADFDSIIETDTQVLLSKISEMKDYRRWAMSICLNYGINTVFSRVNEFNSSSP